MTYNDERPADPNLKDALREPRTLVRLEVSRKEFEQLPFKEQVAVRRAVDDSMRILVRRYRRYSRPLWRQMIESVLRGWWLLLFPPFGIAVIALSLYDAAQRPLKLAWIILTATIRVLW